MSDIEKVIKGLEECSKADFNPCMERVCPYAPKNTNNFCDCRIHLLIDALELMKEQKEKMEHLNNITLEYEKEVFRLQAMLKEQETEWEHLWDAPDGTYKGRCKKCGFVHFFIENHDGQYRFCPSCGKAVK